MMAVFASVNSLVQLIVTNDMRGRVMSIYNFAFRGGMTMGNLMSGWLVPIFSAPLVVFVNGCCWSCWRAILRWDSGTSPRFSSMTRGNRSACWFLMTALWPPQLLLRAGNRPRPPRPPGAAKTIDEYSAAAARAPNDADAQYRLALACSYLAEVAQEQRDKTQAQKAAEQGIKAAERAVALRPDAENYRLLGMLHGQAVTDLMSGLSYGPRAKTAIDKAVELAPNRPPSIWRAAWGTTMFRCSLAAACNWPSPIFARPSRSTRKRRSLPLAGNRLHKENQNAEARQALAKSLELDPNRLWAKQELDKIRLNEASHRRRGLSGSLASHLLSISRTHMAPAGHPDLRAHPGASPRPGGLAQ